MVEVDGARRDGWMVMVWELTRKSSFNALPVSVLLV